MPTINQLPTVTQVSGGDQLPLYLPNTGDARRCSLTTLAQWLGDNNVDVDASDVSFIQAGAGAVIRTSQDKMRETISVKDYGAVGDGVTNDTAAIQAAIDYVESIDYSVSLGGGRPSIRIPAGIYLVSGLTCDKIVEFYGDGMGSTILKLAAGATGSLFTLNAENITGTSLDDTNHCRFDNMTLLGNRVDSVTTGSSRGLDCPATSWPASTQYSASVICNNVEIFNFTGDGIYLGVNRNWAILNNTIVRYCNDNAIAMYSYDNLVSNSSFGVCKNFGVRMYAGGSNTFTNCTIFYSKSNVVINSFVNSPCFFTNCALDAAAEDSVIINGPATPISHVFTGCRLSGSSRSAANTYSDFSVAAVVGGAQIIGCTFALSVQPVQYLVKMNATSKVYFTGNYFETTGSVPYGTAITNYFTSLISSGYIDAWAGSYGGAGTYSVVVNGVEKMRVDANRNIQYQTTRVEGVTPAFSLYETDASANSGKWLFGANANQFSLQALNDSENTFSDAIRVTRSAGDVSAVAIGGALGLPSYAKASLPTASVVGRMIYVTDDVGGAVPAFSDGSNWRRVTDRAIIA